MNGTHTLVTIDATAFGEFLEGLAVDAEAKQVLANGIVSADNFYNGLATAYRGMLETLTAHVAIDSPWSWLVVGRPAAVTA